MAIKQVVSGRVFSVLMVALSSVLPAYMCLPAEAQSGQKTNAPNTQSNKTAKDFQFEVVSIRLIDPERSTTGHRTTPDGCWVAMTLNDLIKVGYSPDDHSAIDTSKIADSTQVINAPNWGYYRIDARVAHSDMPAWQAQGKNQELLRSAIRAVLKDRFQLALHEQQTKVQGYNLVVGRKGIQFKPSVPGAVLPAYFKFPDGGVSTLVSRDPNQPARFYNATIADLLSMLNKEMDLPIHDDTGLTGHYDFSVYRLQNVDPGDRYVLEKIGLELKPGTGPGLNLIVDHIEKPSPN